MSVISRKRVIKLVSNNKKITWENYLKEYLLWKKAEGRSDRTIKDYSYHVKHFFKRFPDTSFSETDKLKSNIIEYMSEDVKPAYYNNKLVYLKTFFEWCVKEKLLTENPLKNLKEEKPMNELCKLMAIFLEKYYLCQTRKLFPA